jgi:hypothetical protein
MGRGIGGSMRPSVAICERRRRPEDGERGSALLLTLFACLALAVTIQTLTVVLICGQRAVGQEALGRERLSESSDGLATLRMEALTAWASAPWHSVGERPGTLTGRLVQVLGGGESVLRAEVRQGTGLAAAESSAWVERGRDGLDLPMAALVGERVQTAAGRSLPWLEAAQLPVGDGSDGNKDEGSAPAAVGYLADLPEAALVGGGCSLVQMAESWRVDDGWLGLLVDEGGWARGVIVMAGEPGRTLTFPEMESGASPEAPVLAIVWGGADLDARGRGDLYGVLVVDGGSVFLEATKLHGAVFVSELVDCGLTGTICFDRELLSWATERSLTRTRLVPGTRCEGTE